MLEHGHKEFYGERGRHVGDARPGYCTLLVQSTVLQRLVENTRAVNRKVTCAIIFNIIKKNIEKNNQDPVFKSPSKTVGKIQNLSTTKLLMQAINSKVTCANISKKFS